MSLTSSWVAYRKLNVAPLSTNMCLYVIFYTHIITTHPRVCMHIHQDLLILSVNQYGVVVLEYLQISTYNMICEFLLLILKLPSCLWAGLCETCFTSIYKAIRYLLLHSLQTKTSPNLHCNHPRRQAQAYYVWVFVLSVCKVQQKHH